MTDWSSPLTKSTIWSLITRNECSFFLPIFPCDFFRPQKLSTKRNQKRWLISGIKLSVFGEQSGTSLPTTTTTTIEMQFLKLNFKEIVPHFASNLFGILWWFISKSICMTQLNERREMVRKRDANINTLFCHLKSIVDGKSEILSPGDASLSIWGEIPP